MNDTCTICAAPSDDLRDVADEELCAACVNDICGHCPVCEELFVLDDGIPVSAGGELVVCSDECAEAVTSDPNDDARAALRDANSGLFE